MSSKNSSYAKKVKNELVQMENEKLCCRWAELAAIIHLRGYIILQRKVPVLTIITDNNSVARYVFKLLKELLETYPKILHRQSENVLHDYFIIKIEEEVVLKEIFQQLEIKKKHNWINMPGVSEKLVKNNCCRRSYIRGSFLAGGSINSPESAYHLEIFVEYETYAQFIIDLLQGFGIKASLRKRENGYYVYLKNAEAIMEFLRVIKAYPALLYMEEKRVIKSLKNYTNRSVNCDTANLDKISKAAHQQLNSIETIEQLSGLNKLPLTLQTAAKTRRKYPEASLKELAELNRPPLSKSGMNYRLKRLNQIAFQLKNKS